MIWLDYVRLYLGGFLMEATREIVGGDLPLEWGGGKKLWNARGHLGFHYTRGAESLVQSSAQC
jgi:hypothetical protein